MWLERANRLHWSMKRQGQVEEEVATGGSRSRTSKGQVLTTNST